MTDFIRTLRTAGVLSALDTQLAQGLAALVGESRDEVLLATALASLSTRDGHVCADLARLADTEIRGDDGVAVLRCPSLASFRAALSTSPLVSDGARLTPLVLDSTGRLYLRRHWEHEQELSRALRARALRPIDPADPMALQRLLLRLFGPRSEEPDWQRIAAQIAAVSSLSVVSGGPGTGKTSTVTKIIALAIADALAKGNPRPRALLLAPTGKAAARLAEAAGHARGGLDCPPEILARIPTDAKTVHRALEPDRSGRFRVDAEHPLFADVVVVDEASMIDVSLMRHLVEAVPPSARLVLLGDRHQLSSVDAGAVLSDVCGDAGFPRYSAALAERLEATFGERLPAETVGSFPPDIDDAVVTLTRTYRFDATSALGELSLVIQRGDADRAIALLLAGGSELELVEPHREHTLDPRLLRRAVQGFAPLAESTTAAEALNRLGRFRVLCAHRKGPTGVDEVNDAIERGLLDSGVLRPRSGFAHPVLVVRNDPSLQLFNGDVGVLFRDPGPGGATRAVFRMNGELRALAPVRLPPNERAFAMTVHKSQGSEFDDVAIVLPAPGSPLLTRELLYTGITRARRRVVIHGTAAAVREAVLRPATRASGLSDALRDQRPAR